MESNLILNQRRTPKDFRSSQDRIRSEIESRLKCRDADKRRRLTQIASELGISETVLSEYRSGRRKVTRKAFQKYLRPLFQPQALAELEETFNREEKNSFLPEEGLALHTIRDGKPLLTLEQEFFCSDPMSYCVLQMFHLEDFRPSMRWFQRRSGLTLKALSFRLKNLEKLGLLAKAGVFYERTRLYPVSPSAKVAPEAWKQFRKNWYESILARNEAGLDQDTRHFYNWIINIDVKDLNTFKREIGRFIKKMNRLQYLSAPKDVYQLEVSLFPMTLTKKEEKLI